MRTILILVLAVAAVTGGVLLQMNMSKSTDPVALLRYPQPKQLQAFSLTSTTGESFTNAELLGKWHLVFFGFTNCPDICPTSLLAMRKAYEAIEQEVPSLADQLGMLLISVDPDRDSPEKMAQYLTAFHPKLVGATGEHPQLQALTQDIGALYVLPQGYESQERYNVDHSAGVYVIDPQGRLHGLFRAPLDAYVMASDMTVTMRDPAGS